jgi:hypothetical protein
MLLSRAALFHSQADCKKELHNLIVKHESNQQIIKFIEKIWLNMAYEISRQRVVIIVLIIIFVVWVIKRKNVSESVSVKNPLIDREATGISFQEMTRQ